MNSDSLSRLPVRLLGLGATLLMVSATAWADVTPRVLHRFGAEVEGAGSQPHLPPVYRDSDGALLGMSPTGGASTYGAYYQLSDAEDNDYRASSFPDAGPLGLYTGLVIDSQGRVYGGSNPPVFLGDQPQVFRWAPGDQPLSAVAAGDLENEAKAAFKPRGLFAVDADDNVYFGGGSGRAGNGLFRLAADGALTLLVDFQLPDYVQGSGNQTVYLKGQYPVALAVDDQAGVLYGINVRDQSAGVGESDAVPADDETAGTLFRIDLSDAAGEGATPVTVLHTFAKNAEGEIKGNDAGQQALVLDGEWLYGTTTLGVWRYHLKDADSFTLLHRFGDGDGEDGREPWGPLVRAEDGHIYGVTRRTSAGGAGALYRIRVGGADDRGDDAYELLHLFNAAQDGSSPNGLSAGPVNGKVQTLYGASSSGGDGNGTVYAVDLDLPVSASIQIEAQPATVTVGESSTLTWSVADASQCVGEGDWGGNKAERGDEKITPALDGKYNYTLSCVDGSGEPVSASATLTVKAAASEPEGGSGGGSSGGGGGSGHYLMLLVLAALLSRRVA